MIQSLNKYIRTLLTEKLRQLESTGVWRRKEELIML